MQSDIQERIAIDLLTVPSLIFRGMQRKLIRTTLADLDINITPHHFEIMRLLEEEGTLHACEIGGRLQIARAQMTSLIEKLADLDMVSRDIDATDRRTYNISLTTKGSLFLEEHKSSLMRAVIATISHLTDEELTDLSDSLRKLRVILLRLQQPKAST